MTATYCGKRAIADGWARPVGIMLQVVLVATRHDPTLKLFAQRLRKAGKPHKVIIAAVTRKPVTIANTLRSSRQTRAVQPSRKITF